jgi:alpha-amylase
MKPFRLYFFSAAGIFLLLTGCSPAALPATSAPTPTRTVQPSATPVGTDSFPWWNDRVFYEIFVRSFRDSDGDGIGDFNGVTEKLDYLQSLGVKGIWLMPIQPSPTYHGYDVTDYYAVNPDYGTMEDFKRLLDEAHKRDIKVIMDLVLNHTSSQHPWFISAQTPGSKDYEKYIWSDYDPRTPGPLEKPAWHPASNGKYYYGVFEDTMPDLNYNTPAVREESKKIASFWLKDVGVDGFRLDAARYLVEDGKILADSKANHRFLEEWETYVRSVNPQAFTVGEVATGNFTVQKYVNTNTELDSAFNFDLASAILSAINRGDAKTLKSRLLTTIQDFPEQDNSNFLTNHDQNRLMEQVLGDKEKAKVAAAILLTTPGIPFIYYGEELGMSGAKPDEKIRTPMQWSPEPGAGFTSGIPWEAINANYTDVNVQTETGDDTSLLERYRELIQLRNEHSALRVGETYVATSDSSKLLSYLRVSDEEAVFVLINMDDKPVTGYALSLATGPLSGNYTVTSLMDDSTYNPMQANAKGGFDKYIPLEEASPYSVILLQLNNQ